MKQPRNAAPQDRASEELRRGLDEQTLATLDALRVIIAGASSELVETIKWNAPNFSLHGEDRITLGVVRGGGVRMVLHRGAKPKDTTQFEFADPAGLAEWPAPDRGVVVFRDRQHVQEHAEALRVLCERWLLATR